MASSLLSQSAMFKRFLTLFWLLLAASPVYAFDTVANPNLKSIPKVELMKKMEAMLTEIKISSPLSEQKVEKKTDNGGWGGGTVVLRGPESPILYDLYLAEPHYRETFNIAPNFPETDFLRAMGYEYFKLQQMAEYPALVAHLEKWRPKAAGLVSLILQSLKSIEVSYTTTPFIRIDGLVLTRPLEPGHQLEPVILFNRVMNMRLYLPYWKRMGDQSRLGALIHEAFRNIQIVGGFKDEESGMDLKIEKITQFLIMHDPSELQDNLDYTQFFDGALLRYLKIEEIRSLSLIDYMSIYHPQSLKDPKTRQRLLNPKREELFQAQRSSTSLLDDRIQFYKSSDMYPEGMDAIDKSETFIRDYLKYPQEFSKSARFQAETFMKALRLLNKHVQERWVDDSSVLLSFDLKTLIFLQLEFPKVDIFGNMDKYGCLTMTHWSTPVDKFQSRDSDKMQLFQQQEQPRRMQCMEKVFENNPKMMLKYLQIVAGSGS